MRNIFTMVLIVLVLTGCASVGKKIEQNKVQQIKEGVTTEQEVIELLGKPFMKTLSSDGKVIMIYQYTKVKNRIENFIPVVGLLSGGMDMRQQMLTILIDKNGNVEQYTFNDAESEINSGLLNAD